MSNRAKVAAFLKRLREGEVMELDGLLFRRVEGEVAPGDLYISGRNTGPHLLTCKEVKRPGNYVIPTCNSYPFDVWECIKVEEVQEEN